MKYSKIIENPKAIGSGIIGCVPQIGICPRKCDDCFAYGSTADNYISKAGVDLMKEPYLPNPVDVNKRGLIVRVNDLNDSHHQKKLVIESTACYDNRFFNTSYPDTDFPGPVVITVNPGNITDKNYHLFEKSPNVMFVRFRANLWNKELMDKACWHYSQLGIPVVLTWMRYTNRDSIPPKYRNDYEERQHILNTYWALSYQREWEETQKMAKQYKFVYMCGTQWTASCSACGNCLREYHATKERIQHYVQKRRRN